MVQSFLIQRSFLRFTLLVLITVFASVDGYCQIQARDQGFSFSQSVYASYAETAIEEYNGWSQGGHDIRDDYDIENPEFHSYIYKDLDGKQHKVVLVVFAEKRSPDSVIYVYFTVSKDGFMEKIKRRAFSARRTEKELDRDVAEVIDGWRYL